MKNLMLVETGFMRALDTMSTNPSFQIKGFNEL